jgi:transcriptional regulator with XRE-family HTH domain
MSEAEDPNVQRRKLGIELRRSREAARLTQREVAKRLEWSLSKVIRIEAGAQGLSITDLKAMLDVLEVTDEKRATALMEAARGSHGQAWWNSFRDIVSPQFARFLGYEGLAASFRVFHPLLMPGLLHTEEYASALLGVYPELDRARRVVELRLERQGRLLAQSDLAFSFILDEEALYRWIGGPLVMRRQLEYLIEASQRPNVSVQIVPFSAGSHPGLRGPFIMLQLKETDEELLFLESPSGDQLVRDEPGQISEYAIYFERLSELALPEEQGYALIQEQADRLRHAEKTAVDGSGGR